MLLIPSLSMNAYVLPDDADIAVPAIKALIDGAKVKIRIICYGFDHPVLLAALAAACKRGIDVRLILDLSQSKGQAEARALKLLMTTIPPHNFRIGTSALDQIIHDKVALVDDGFVIEGSFNWSLSAPKQMNTLNLVSSSAYNTYLNQRFDTQWAWLTAREPQDQAAGWQQ